MNEKQDPQGHETRAEEVAAGPSADQQRWAQIDQALDCLLDADPEERQDLVTTLSEGDPSLEEELRSLLVHLESRDLPAKDDPLESGVVATTDQLFQRLEEEMVKGRVYRHSELGPYRLGERLAVGGMGRVYRAHRADGMFTKEVAVKLLRWELPEADLEKRFEQERQILARLDHPAVARLIDGGVAEDGVPYLVMDLVEGRSIDQYCREEGLTTLERLRLLLPIIDAVRYAHGQLVVHRDIKPSNILVNGKGESKLLDFGVAKLLDPEMMSGLTVTGSGPYTPSYASPEQLLGGTIGTATDIYSLGCLLYELSTGETPFPKPRAGQLDLRLSGQLPPPPSSQVVGGKRALWRDLDAIVLKALRFEAAERYSGADALARDLHQLLDGLPVEAMPPSRTYRARKFLRRHALAVALVTLAASSLVGGTLVAWQQGKVAAEQRDSAQRLADFSLEMLRLGDPGETGSSSVSARELLEGGAARAANLEDPETRGRVLAVIGEGLANLQVNEPAASSLLASAAAFGYPAASEPRIPRLLRRAALATAEAGDLERALSLSQEAIARQEALLGRDHGEVADGVFERAFLVARYTPPTSPRRSQVFPLLDRAIEIQSRLAPQGSEALAKSLHLRGMQEMASLHSSTERADSVEVEAALGSLREAVAMRRRIDTQDGLTLVESLNDIALVLDTIERNQEAIEYLEEALAEGGRTIHPSHPTLLTVRQNLAAMFREMERFEESEALYLDLMEAWRKAEVETPLKALSGLAFVYAGQGRLEEAAQKAREAQSRLGEQQPSYWLVSTLLGDILRRQGRVGEARPLLEESVERCEILFGPHSNASRQAREALEALQGVR
ncbi:MAG: protein kinase [Deltaproteobacteria bacterium]|nr:protein kinase [Deltaproteobacteria bacterium]